MKRILFLSILTFLICIPIKVNATTKSEIPESKLSIDNAVINHD